MSDQTRLTGAHENAADQVIALVKGKIIERGSHKELMPQNGHYAHLVYDLGKGLLL